MQSVWNSIPDVAVDGPLDANKGKGPLSIVGDPVGQVLDKSLKHTAGRLTGAIAKPSGQALLDVQGQAKKEVGYEKADKKEEDWPGGKSIGGNAQTGQNPLGL